jgi:hypothetical protein
MNKKWNVRYNIFVMMSKLWCWVLKSLKIQSGSTRMFTSTGQCFTNPLLDLYLTNFLSYLLFTPVISGVRVAQSLVFCVVFRIKNKCTAQSQKYSRKQDDGRQRVWVIALCTITIHKVKMKKLTLIFCEVTLLPYNCHNPAYNRCI